MPREQPVRVRRLPVWKWTAAAAIVLTLGIGSYLGLLRKRAPSIDGAQQAQRFKNDVLPGGNKAILTLAGGQRIILDSAANGTLARQGGTDITKTDSGMLAYKSQEEKPTEVLFNTLTTPRGGQYRLVLPDGTRVWLNAASAITYPTAFTGKTRTVSIAGEAYFEVAKDAARPFQLTAGTISVAVLGTAFDVNAYSDEPDAKATLLEGSVRVINAVASPPGEARQLLPGQQAQIQGGAIRVNKDVDLEAVMAWKNGSFTFSDATIEAVMRQLARWYDVTVVYDTKVSQHFVADIPRNVPVSEVLKLLEMTGQVHFTIEGKKITVIR
jgi:transmembrane sensor